MFNQQQHSRPPLTHPSSIRLLPGITLATLIGFVAFGIQQIETSLVGHPVVEALVIAIFLGMLWRNLVGVGARLKPGVDFSAKQLLEFAIVLLGASINLPTLMAAGPTLLLAIIVAVVVGIGASMLIGRGLGLSSRLAILIAVGNSICGNSAIAAVAPVIKASSEEIASSIALTAVVGVVVVVSLPLLIPLVGLTYYQYGVLAGMTVYTVPQVVAATFPVSALSGEVGTLVKLVRVLLLGPVVLICSLLYGSRSEDNTRIELGRFVPWFIAGFVLLGVARSLGLLPASMATPLRELSRWLTIVAMAALGLGVDVRALRQVGLPVSATILASLGLLIMVSLLLIVGLGINGV